jgi:hypothetical protein
MSEPKRQPHGERTAESLPTLDLDRAAVLLHDLANAGQTDT